MFSFDEILTLEFLRDFFNPLTQKIYYYVKYFSYNVKLDWLNKFT